MVCVWGGGGQAGVPSIVHVDNSSTHTIFCMAVSNNREHTCGRVRHCEKNRHRIAAHKYNEATYFHAHEAK